jgi:hypothetical protein
MNKSSTHDIVTALKIVSTQIESSDGVAQALCLEAASRLVDMVKLTSDLTAHILASPVHHPRCNAKTKGTYCNCVLARVIPS